MRWDDLFDDLDRRFDEMQAQVAESDLAEQTRQEQGTVSMVERLSGALGRQIAIRLTGSRTLSGTLTRLGSDWLLLTENLSSETVVPLAAVAVVEGLTLATGRPLRSVDARYDLRMVLRAVARDRAPVTVQTTYETELSGTIDRVGADFIEIAAHSAWETRRTTAVRSVVLVPLHAVLLVRAMPLG